MSIITPQRKRYKKVCTCGNWFYCDGICIKAEVVKQEETYRGACFCPTCFVKMWGEANLCDCRKRLLHGKTKYKQIIEPEKVEFT